MDRNALRTGKGDPTAYYGKEGDYQPGMRKWKMACVAKHADGIETIAWDGGVWVVQPHSLCSVPEGAAKHYFEGDQNYTIISDEEAKGFAEKAVKLLELSKKKKDNTVRRSPYQLLMESMVKKK